MGPGWLFIVPSDLVAFHQYVVMLRELLDALLVPGTCVRLAGSGCHFLNPWPISGSDPGLAMCKQIKSRGQRPELDFASISHRCALDRK